MEGHLARTAVGAALMRAVETARPDRLFDDPFAERFCESFPEALDEETTGDRDPGLVARAFEAFAFHVAVRTRWLDDVIEGALASGCRQVVLLGAGLDARAYRLPLQPGVHLFELDQRQVLEAKESVLRDVPATARCRRTAVPADLQATWPAALAGAGFSPSLATAWAAEGLLVYLDGAEATGILGSMAEQSAPGSLIAFDLGSGVQGSLAVEVDADPGLNPFAALWQPDRYDPALGMLADAGWDVQAFDTGAVGRGYGRPAPDGAGGTLVTARAVDPARDRRG
jgi:methyltransferase (TIGR00027 family)